MTPKSFSERIWYLAISCISRARAGSPNRLAQGCQGVIAERLPYGVPFRLLAYRKHAIAIMSGKRASVFGCVVDLRNLSNKRSVHQRNREFPLTS